MGEIEKQEQAAEDIISEMVSVVDCSEVCVCACVCVCTCMFVYVKCNVT